MGELWERLSNETTKAYAAFCIYRDLGSERSIDKVLAATGKRNRSSLIKWSSRYNWVERVQAYDQYLEELKRKEQEQAIIEMSRRHAELAVRMQELIKARLEEIDVNALSPRDLATWLDIATKLERLSRGEPTSIEKGETDEPIIIEIIKQTEGTNA